MSVSIEEVPEADEKLFEENDCVLSLVDAIDDEESLDEKEEAKPKPFVKTPLQFKAAQVLNNITSILNPKRDSGIGHKPFKGQYVLRW